MSNLKKLRLRSLYNKSKTVFRTWHFVFFAILAMFVSLCSAYQAIAQHEAPFVFLAPPYVQLGDQPELKDSESMEIVWLTGSSVNEEQDWRIEFDCSNKGEWKKGKIGEVKAICKFGLHDQLLYRYTARVFDLNPGEPFTYRIFKKDRQVFQAASVARKGRKQPYRFAVVGDVGAGTDGQKQVVYQMLKQKPDFLMIPGDIVYLRGLVSEYLERFFPIMNCDSNSPSTGAPFMRSVLTMASNGNHDIALANPWEGTNLSKFPDALGYFLMFSQPTNGPCRLVNGKNTTRIVGTAEKEIAFVKAAGKRFPTMSNYSFDYGNSHWVVLDGNSYMDWTDKKTRDWVDKDLEKAKSATWKFAAFHQPGFSVDLAHASEQRMRLLSDIFEKHKVDVVFAGHAHCYQRSYPLKFKTDWTKVQGPYHDAIDGTIQLDKKYDGSGKQAPNGVIYIVTGGGGAALYARGASEQSAPFIHKYVYAHSFTLCDAIDNSLRISQVSTEGKILDQFTLTKAIALSR